MSARNPTTVFRRAAQVRRWSRSRRASACSLVVVGLCSLTAMPSQAQYLVHNICDGIAKRETTLTAQVRVVQQAVEQFAVEHGSYPATVSDFQEYLPGGLLLRNVFTFALTEPVDAYAVNPGEIGYEPYRQNGVNWGYLLTAFSSNVLIEALEEPRSVPPLQALPESLEEVRRWIPLPAVGGFGLRRLDCPDR